MKFSDCLQGMKVIPKKSTHPRGTNIESIVKYHLVSKGYLIICDRTIDYRDDGQTIFCHERGRQSSYGHFSLYDCLKFRPEDLEPISKNELFFARFKRKKRGSA